MQQVGNELQNMADNLVDAFKIVKDSIDDLREKCGSSYSDDKNYKDNNDKNINILADQNSALQEKTSILENSNKNIIDTNNKIIKEINNQTENINNMNKYMNNLNEDNNKSKAKIKENEECLKKIKYENENSLKDLSIKYTNLEDKLNKLVTQNDKIVNEIKIIKENILELQNANKK